MSVSNKLHRTIEDHKVNAANSEIDIRVLDEPGAGGACHEYEIGPSRTGQGIGVDMPPFAVLKFQNGPIKEAGVNGVTQEALLAIVADRLRSFQSGQYSCRENAIALTKIEEAQHWLHSRTRARMSRGVEGTNTV